MKIPVLVALLMSALMGGCSIVKTTPGIQGQKLRALTDMADHWVAVTLTTDRAFILNTGGVNLYVTLPAGRYFHYGRDAAGAYYARDGGVGMNSGKMTFEKGGIFVPDRFEGPIGFWILPLGASAASSVRFVGDLPKSESDSVVADLITELLLLAAKNNKANAASETPK